VVNKHGEHALKQQPALRVPTRRKPIYLPCSVKNHAMKTLEIRRSTLRDAFALFGLIFYMNVIYFFMALSSSSRLRGMQNDSEGNVVNQVCGLITFAVPLYLFIKHKIYLRKSFYQQNLVFIFFLSTVLL